MPCQQCAKIHCPAQKPLATCVNLNLFNLMKKKKIPVFGHTSYILSTYWPPVASGCLIGQKDPLSREILPGGTMVNASRASLVSTIAP